MVTGINGNVTTHQLDANAVSLMESLQAGGQISVANRKKLADRIADLN